MFYSPPEPHTQTFPEDTGESTLLLDPPCGPVASVRETIASGAWRVPLGIFLISLIAFCAFSANHLRGPSPDTHFVYLAATLNSMIAAPFSEEAASRRQGKLPFELDRDPPHRNDWASYWELTLGEEEVVRGVFAEPGMQGTFLRLDGQRMELRRQDIRQQQQRYYVSFPPAPAVLMMPFVAVFGYGLNDVLWTIVFASLNVMLVFLLLRRLSVGGRSQRSQTDNLWLTFLFGFGSVHLWCAIIGQVWFTALIMGITFTLLYLLCAIDARRPWLAGIFLALAFSTRTSLLFTSLVFFLFVFFPAGSFRNDNWKEAMRKLLLFCIPCLVVGGCLLWVNYIRFESLTEFGHRYLAGGQIPRIKEYGLFHAHFLSKNLTAMWALAPEFSASAPYIRVSRHGLGILFTMPALVWLLWPRRRQYPADHFYFRVMWLAVTSVAIFHLFYQNTGYEQFGYRFSLDYLVYLIVLLAIGRRRFTRTFKVLVLIGFAVNAFGAITFKRMQEFYFNGFFP